MSTTEEKSAGPSARLYLRSGHAVDVYNEFEDAGDLYDILRGSPRFVQIGDAVVHTGAVCGAELL